MILSKFLKLSILSLFLSIVISCDKKKESTPKNNSLVRENVNSFLDEWHLAAAEANYENYFNKMDSISVFIGTDATENWQKSEFENFSKPYFDKGKAWSFKAIERNLYTNDDQSFIWFDELLSTWMGLCRGSGVVEQKNGKFSIKHYVLSITVPNDDVQQLIQIKKETDSILTQKILTK